MPTSYMTLPRSRLLAPLSLVATLLATTTCHDSQGPRSPAEVGRAPVPMMAAAVSNAVTLVGTGNIARCDRTNDEATAAILDTIAGTVFALGDGAYPNGTPTNYQNCYNASWGRHKARTYPGTGNHDYDSSATAAGYFGYFGAAAGDPTKGYYSYDLGAWHITRRDDEAVRAGDVALAALLLDHVRHVHADGGTEAVLGRPLRRARHPHRQRAHA